MSAERADAGVLSGAAVCPECGNPDSRGDPAGLDAGARADKADTDIADTRAAGVGEQPSDGGWSGPEPGRDRSLLFDAPWVVRLFDSPHKPPLYRRRDFLRAALGVFVLRGGLAFVYGLLVQELGLAFYGAPGNGAWLVQAALLIPLVPFLLCPYFFVLYRRLRGVGVKRPARVVRLLVLAFVLLLLISGWLIAWFWLDLFMFAPYLILLACKDRTEG